MKALQIQVFGIVQGVGFRFFTKQKADSLSLKGNVQNKEDGSVLINVFGDKKLVFDFLAWCHNGPPSSQVTRIEYGEIDALKLDGFNIIRA